MLYNSARPSFDRFHNVLTSDSLQTDSQRSVNLKEMWNINIVFFYKLSVRVRCITMLIDAARDRRAYRSSGERIIYGLLEVFFFNFCSIFVESTETIGQKFGHNVWIGPEGENR